MDLKKYWPVALSFFGVLVLDMGTKEYILAHVPLFSFKAVIPGFFNLIHIKNEGVAFGILNGSAPMWKDVLLVLFPILAIVGILIFVFCCSPRKIGILLSLGGILGGALGNLVDRLRFRGVIDFLDFYWGSYHWPAFNIADSAITVGVLTLLIFYLKEG
jgi:signal peptidase II